MLTAENADGAEVFLVSSFLGLYAVRSLGFKTLNALMHGIVFFS
jgi:hypothetical protein